jgi:hypothetical protein
VPLLFNVLAMVAVRQRPGAQRTPALGSPPPGPAAGWVRPSVLTPARLGIARQLDTGEHTFGEIAQAVGVGRATLYRHLLGTMPPAR